MFQYLRKVVEKIPFLATSYRIVRDEFVFNRVRPIQTSFGFSFVRSGLLDPDGYEPEVTDLIRERLADADVFVDVGANIGFFSCLARSLDRQVVAFEPLHQNLRYLYRNLELNGWGDVEVYPLGLADRPGLLTLFGGSTGASLLSGWADASPLLRRTIPVSTLDNLLGDRFVGRRLVIKVDVEGAEYLFLRGAEHIMAMSPKPFWVIEICLTEHHPGGSNPRFAETFDLFWRHGYGARVIGPEGKTIQAEDIARWTADGGRDFDSPNFFFFPLDQE